MSWEGFVISVSGLLTLVIFLVALPWLRRRSVRARDVLTNTQIIRQRLDEIAREAKEGIISDSDQKAASEELKLALLDEVQKRQHNTAQKAYLPLIAGGGLAVIAAVTVYAKVNHIEQVKGAEQAIESLPALSEKLSSGEAAAFTNKDITDLTYAIRARLRSNPDDATGWMFLARLWLSVGQDEQAIQAIEKALALNPDDTTIRITYAQTLMVTNEVAQMTKAQSVLQGLLAINPNNDNLALMMAVVSARLGDLANTTRYFEQVKDKLSPENDTRIGLEQRINALAQQKKAVSEAEHAIVSTGFEITVSIDDAVSDKLPGDGYLIVYAQDGNSQNRMPAAVVKIPLQKFPVTLTLTNDNAMMPEFTLSTLTQAKLTARVSSDENVMPAAGDLQGVISVPVDPGEVRQYSITINKEVL
ncbi:c-type cytochrome biogenesis protein CcmI [Aestuariibacter sp. A3R04]|uniref:c-type cytochrome biogenesis protein CcmI n=1 Tax=Aestuariibacter sp. A3R04 TaxID=2841571 RepID=UPI001C096DB9|nr:c-type cytochrome biogenesis protein CcmI [Aestuariibacter sp. A3R04]MBU3022087.1 c-type cytochrome biogenesis protein CcmI [Aestuariibacter sp. A3R04]